MAIYTTFNIVGFAEDISDVISNISPTKTPFISSIGDDNIHARLFQWQEDSLRATQVNAVIEGADAVDQTLSPTVMRNNNTQILEKTIKVSKTSDAIKEHGRAKETAYQIAKAAEEIKRDLEVAMIGINQAAVAGDGVATAAKFTSAIPQISAATTTAGGTASLTEAKVLANHQAVYTAGGDPEIFMIKPADSIIVAGFNAATGRYSTTPNEQKITNAVKVYVSPFGELKVVLNRFQLTSVAFTYAPDMWKRAVLRPWTRTALAQVGDAEKHQLIGEFSLKHMNQSASGLINALT